MCDPLDLQTAMYYARVFERRATTAASSATPSGPRSRGASCTGQPGSGRGQRGASSTSFPSSNAGGAVGATSPGATLQLR